nr:CDP-alcohol phosphatidyltransferase family protein [Deltaproteobacteria bacterium]
MERLVILGPAIAAAGIFVGMFIVYCGLVVSGRAPNVAGVKSNEVLGPFWANYVVWMLRPLERVLVASGVSPTLVTWLSVVACAAAGVAIALGHLASGAWLFIAGGILDMLDGRLARAQNRQSAAGALFDSVSDRWAELALFTGCAWFLHDDGWLFAVMAAVAGSLMVSYTRARGEGLGLELRSGAMQRAERILLIAIGALAAAWFDASPATEAYVAPTLGGALAICGALAMWTALG